MDRTQTISHAASVMFDPEVSGAELVTYNGTNIYAHVEYGQDAAGGVVPGRVARLTVLRSDVAMPDYKDEVVISGESWRVHQGERRNLVIEGDEMTWTMWIVSRERARVSRP